MGNIIKLNTVFTDPTDGNPFGEVPSIAALNSAIYSEGTNGGNIVALEGFVRLNNMKSANVISKGAYYVFGYGLYNGNKTDEPSHSNYDHFVYLDGGSTAEFQNRELIVDLPDGKFMVPLLIINPQGRIPSGTTIDDMIESY